VVSSRTVLGSGTADATKLLSGEIVPPLLATSPPTVPLPATEPCWMSSEPLPVTKSLRISISPVPVLVRVLL